MNRPTDKQIEEVLAGIASPEDAKYVAEWFATEEGSDYLEAAMTQDSELIKNEFADLYVDHDIPSKKILEQIRKNIRIKKLKRICFRVAAVLIPVVLIVGLYMQLNSKVDLFGTSEYEEVVVDKGERIQIMFQDGTKVYINSDSKLRYPKKFALNTREVYLEGEAYFVVAKNKNRPFIVNLSGPAIHVLGTSFNVNTYKKDVIETSLLTGKIKISGGSLPHEYTLTPGEKATYSSVDKALKITKADVHVETGWCNDYLIFDSEPLIDVIEQIERWYGVEIELKYPQIAQDLLSGSFRHENIQNVIHSLSLQYKFKYEIHKDKIIIY